ncbi:MAG: SHOCT domain-containing protein [Sedimenticola sp.]|nr:SHOCT domain-containing protein [Sedimenticola sp.]
MMGNGYGMGFGGIFMWLFWILVILGVVWLVKLMMVGRDGDLPSESSALEILKERYARGEIDRDEFEQKRRDLED